MIKTTITIGSDILLPMTYCCSISKTAYLLIFQRVCNFVDVPLADIGLPFFLDL